MQQAALNSRLLEAPSRSRSPPPPLHSVDRPETRDRALALPAATPHVGPGRRTGLAVYDSSAIATAHTGHSAHDGNLPLRRYSPAQKGIISTPAGSASHAPTAVLVKSASAVPSVDLRSFSPQGQSGMHLSPETLESDRLVPVRCKPGDFLECEGGVHGRLHLGMGSAARGQTVLWPVVRTGKASTHKLLGNDSSRQRAEALLSPDSRTPRLGPFGQHVSGGLYKSPGRYQVPKPLQADGTPPGLGSVQFALAESSARARPPERGTRQTVQEQCSSRRMVLTPTDSPAAVGDIRQSGSRPVCTPSQENAHCPKFFSKSMDALAHVWPRCPLYAFPPVALLPQVLERIRENGCSVLLVAPFWKNQAWFPVLMQLTSTAPWSIPVRRDLLSQARGSIWHPRPELWSLHVWAINGYPLASRREC
ncbi:hypothetical protein PO909_010463 [Leuciscus waleckii]